MKTGLIKVKKTFLTCFIASLLSIVAFSQAVYVDSQTGDDNNAGTEEAPFHSIHKAMEVVKSTDNDIYTIKLNPGIHVLDSTVKVETEKDYLGQPILIEATVNPDDAGWTPDDMPSIMYAGKKVGTFRVVGLAINQSHVKIVGIRHLGFHNICTKYFPIFREDNTLYNLEVEQCMFVADPQVSVIQIGVFAHGDSTRIKNCVFYKTVNAVILGDNSGNEPGNSMTSCIVYGSRESAIWTIYSDSAFVYKYNVVTDCNCFWVYYEEPVRTFSNCIVVNNKHMQCNSNGPSPVTSKLIEDDCITDTTVSLSLLPHVYGTWQKKHLHVTGYGSKLEAGLFIKEQTLFSLTDPPIDQPTNQLIVTNNDVLVYPNPSENTIYIATNNINEEISNYQVTNLMGNKVLEDTFRSNKIDVSALSSGVYVLKLHSENGKSASETIIIQ